LRLRLTLALTLLAPALASTTAAGMPPAGTSVAGGYWTLGVDGTVTGFGDATAIGDPQSALGITPAVDLEPAGTAGYWILDTAGRVHPFGTAADHGDATGLMASGEQATSLSATPDGDGYWVFTDKGRAIPFGDAVHHGDMAGTPLNAPVLDSVVTETGKGYWMVAADGGIFTFGDAAFHGSTGDLKLNAPVQSLVPDGDGSGYWLVASDGGIFSFDAPFRGSMGDIRLNKPVTGMVRYGNGYLMVAEDGGIFTFSDLPFAGSLGDKALAQPIVAVAALGQPKAENAGVVSDTTTTTAATDVVDAPTTTTTTTPSTTSTTTTSPPQPVPLPAGMPARDPDHTVECASGYDTAKVWLTLDADTAWAAHNPCERPLLIAWHWSDTGASSDEGAVVAPGAHFHHAEGPTADRWSARLDNQLVQCWEEGPLPVMLLGADDWAEPGCDPYDIDPNFSGLPPGEPTHVLPCDDGSGSSALVWEPENVEDSPYAGVMRWVFDVTWGVVNPCHDRWVLFTRTGESVSDPYGAFLSVAPGAQLHRRIARMEGEVDHPEGAPTLSSRSGYETNGCRAGFGHYELRPEDAGTPRSIGHCPDAGAFGWYHEIDDDYEGPTCWRREADVIGTSGDDILRPADTNGDGIYVMVGMGGNDRFENLIADGSASIAVYICGGNGSDTVHGYARLVNLGGGNDSLHLSDCRPKGSLTYWSNVETVDHHAYPCGDTP
jgi:hypothetical protein